MVLRTTEGESHSGSEHNIPSRVSNLKGKLLPWGNLSPAVSGRPLIFSVSVSRSHLSLKKVIHVNV